MELVFILAVVFIEISFIDLLEVVEVIRAFRIDTFM